MSAVLSGRRAQLACHARLIVRVDDVATCDEQAESSEQDVVTTMVPAPGVSKIVS